MTRQVTITNLSTPLPRAIRAPYCSSFFCRLRGLMFRSHLASDEGLLLVQERSSRVDASIHMLFVFTDLAVIWLDQDVVNMTIQVPMTRKGPYGMAVNRE